MYKWRIHIYSNEWGENGFERIDFGIQAGLGFNISDNISLNAKYILGVTPVDGEGNSVDESTNTGKSVTIGYIL